MILIKEDFINEKWSYSRQKKFGNTSKFIFIRPNFYLISCKGKYIKMKKKYFSVAVNDGKDWNKNCKNVNFAIQSWYPTFSKFFYSTKWMLWFCYCVCVFIGKSAVKKCHQFLSKFTSTKVLFTGNPDQSPTALSSTLLN